jgi:hypothetical protein
MFFSGCPGCPKKSVLFRNHSFVVNLGLLHLWKFKLASDEQQEKCVLFDNKRADFYRGHFFGTPVRTGCQKNPKPKKPRTIEINALFEFECLLNLSATIRKKRLRNGF